MASFPGIARVVCSLMLAQFLGCGPQSLGPVAQVPKVHAMELERVATSARSEMATARYRIRNDGGGDLILGPIRTTCGCSTATVSPSVVRPGSYGVVVAEARTPDVGENSIHLFVATNDPEARSIDLTLRLVSRVVPPYLATRSAKVACGVLRPGLIPPPRSFILDVVEDGSRPTTLTKATCSLGGVDARIEAVETFPAGSPGLVIRRYRCRVEWRKVVETGRIQGDFLLGGDDPGGPAFRVPIEGVVRGSVLASPPVLVLASDATGVARASITLISEDPGVPLVIDDPEHDPSITVRRVAGDDLTATFEVATTAGLRTPAPGAMRPLAFRTNHADAPLIEVPLRIVANVKESKNHGQ